MRVTPERTICVTMSRMSAKAVAGSGGVRLRSGRGRWVLATAVLGSGIAQLDGTVVNVALPRIGADLDASLAALQWTLNAYTMTKITPISEMKRILMNAFSRRSTSVRTFCSFPSVSPLR